MPETRLQIPSGDIALQGALHTPEGAGPFPAVVVCHPHPQYGGDMNNNVVMAVVRALTGRGIAALRFDFRGVGGSGGSYGGGAGEQDDVRAALAHAATVPEIDASRVGLAGYSFGAWMAAAVAESPALELGALPRPQPPTAGAPPPRPLALALIALPLGTGGDPLAQLAAYPNPLLLVAGDDDHVCPAAALRDLGAALGGRAETQIVPGTDHFWWSHERDLEEIVGSFFTRHLLRAAVK